MCRTVEIKRFENDANPHNILYLNPAEHLLEIVEAFISPLVPVPVQFVCLKINVFFIHSWPKQSSPTFTVTWSHTYTYLWLPSSHNDPGLSENQQTIKNVLKSNYLYLTAFLHASCKQCVLSLVIRVSQCRGEKTAPLWPLSLEPEADSRAEWETGSSKAGLGICKAARLLFFDRVLACRCGEASLWEAAVWRPPQLVEGSCEGSEFTAGLLSVQVRAVWGFPCGHEVDRSGERVADSSRPLVPCVHCWGTRKRRGREKKRQEPMRWAGEFTRQTVAC